MGVEKSTQFNSLHLIILNNRQPHTQQNNRPTDQAKCNQTSASQQPSEKSGHAHLHDAISSLMRNPT